MSDSRSESSSNEDEAEEKPIRKLFQARERNLFSQQMALQMPVLQIVVLLVAMCEMNRDSSKR